MPAEQIASKILPDNVQLLYNFAENQMASKSLEPRRSELYKRIVRLLEESQDWHKNSLVILSEVQENLGDLPGAIETEKLLISLNPDILGFRHRLVNLIIKRCEEIMEGTDTLQDRQKELLDTIAAGKNAWDDLKRKDRAEKRQTKIKKDRKRLNEISEEARKLYRD